MWNVTNQKPTVQFSRMRNVKRGKRYWNVSLSIHTFCSIMFSCSLDVTYIVTWENWSTYGSVCQFKNSTVWLYHWWALLWLICFEIIISRGQPDRWPKALVNLWISEYWFQQNQLLGEASRESKPWIKEIIKQGMWKRWHRAGNAALRSRSVGLTRFAPKNDRSNFAANYPAGVYPKQIR